MIFMDVGVIVVLLVLSLTVKEEEIEECAGVR